MPSRPAPLRVLVVEDSPTQREMLVALLDGDVEMEVVGFVATGAAAVRTAAVLKPDIITMDLRLPDIDGLEATRRIMELTPTPIVIVTAHATDADGSVVSDALQAGALALVEKPHRGPKYQAQSEELLRTVKSMARIRVVRRRTSALRHLSESRAVGRPEIVVIGASTGGPEALRTILTGLPATFPLPILIVQHMAAGFTQGMVAWLGPQCALPIRIATSGTPVPSHGIHLAPAGLHLLVSRGLLKLTADAPIRGHRPSATLLFRSVAEHYGSSAVGVLLTGMGDDGAAGMRDLKDAGAVTIAQDEATSIVFGMPEAAIRLGAVDYVLAPSQIPSLLVDLATAERGG